MILKETITADKPASLPLFSKFAITVTPTMAEQTADPSGREYSDSANLLFLNVSPGWPSVSPSRSGVVESPRRGKWVEWGLYLQSCSLSAP